ncbi:MAG: DUF3800 domain-containing protein [Chloroflexota bacterium]
MFDFFDESGDTGFKFGEGSSELWAGALLSIADPWPLRDRIALLRKELSVSDRFEFHFHDTNERACERFFVAIRPFPFDLRCVVVNKRTLPAEFRSLSRPSFYAHFVTELVLRAPDEAIRNHVLTIDDSTRQLAREIRLSVSKATRERGLSRKFKKIVPRASRQDDLLQCADMVLGAILNWLDGAQPGYYATFAGKVRDLWIYPEKKRGK